MKKFTYLFTIFIVLVYQSLYAQWIRNSGPSGIVYSLALSTNKAGDTNLFAGTQSSGVFLSTNNGISWTKVNNGVSLSYVRGLAVVDTNLFAAAGPVYLSGNNGTSWTKTAPTGFDALTLAVSDTNVFAGTAGGGVFLSNNNGKNWTAVNSGLKDSALFVAKFLVSDTNLFVGTWGGGIFRSTNNGKSWTDVNNGIVNHIHSFAVSSNDEGGTNIFVGTYFGEGIYLSTNNGISWTPVGSSGMTNKNVRAIIVSPKEAGNINMFAGTAGGGVFLSTNKGKSWTTVNSGLTNTTINALIISGPYLFAATGDGIWRRLLSETTTTTSVQINTDNRNGVFGLEQNYPNPFNSSTKISYQVPTTENVTLKVYDILGNEVSTLVNEKKLAGSYEVEFNGQGLAAGTYCYNLRAGNSAEIKKMILNEGKGKP